MYFAYSSDPRPTPSITWTLDSNVGSAYLSVSGVTATLFMSRISPEETQENYFNLAIDSNGAIPTLISFKNWLEDRLTNFFVSGFTVGWAPGFTANSDALDTFIRPDQSDWGTASDGNVWVRTSTGSTDSISSNHGVQIGGVTGVSSWQLGPGLNVQDTELLVKWKATLAPLNAGAVELFMRTSADGTTDVVYIEIAVEGVGSNDALNIQVGADNELYLVSSTPLRTSGVSYWTRFRSQGQKYSFRTWQDGLTEPSTWDGQFTSALSSPGRHVGLSSFLANGDEMDFYYFSATTPTSKHNNAALSLVEGFTEPDA